MPKVTAQLKPHHFKKGQSGNPKGRPKGQIDKVHRLQLQAAATGATPLEILLAIARRDSASLAKLGIPLRDCTTLVRKSAAEAALPYVHRRMPIAVEAEIASRTLVTHGIASLSDAALDHLWTEFENAGIALPGLTNVIEGELTK